jgi:hypothetical protein
VRFGFLGAMTMTMDPLCAFHDVLSYLDIYVCKFPNACLLETPCRYTTSVPCLRTSSRSHSACCSQPPSRYRAAAEDMHHDRLAHRSQQKLWTLVYIGRNTHKEANVHRQPSEASMAPWSRSQHHASSPPAVTKIVGEQQHPRPGKSAVNSLASSH